MLRPPEDFYFEGAEGKQVHGFVVKPYGWKEGDKKKWPGVLLIHGGMLALAKPMSVQYTEQLYRSSRSLGRSVVNEVESKRIFTPRVLRRSNQPDRLDDVWSRFAPVPYSHMPSGFDTYS